MFLDRRFMAAVSEACDAHPGAVEVLPQLLVRACVSVVGVAGAGLSITDGLRVPLAASDESVARAEALQTTLGEGPCLDATADWEPLVADEAAMAARWPVFHQELLAQTPFRSIASLPLRVGRAQRFGALDLYAVDPAELQHLPLDEINAGVADPMAAVLFDSPASPSPYSTQEPSWMGVTSVTDRMNVWVAIGILIEHSGLTNDEALSVLRAYAFGRNTTVDAIAESLTTRRLAADAIFA